MDRNPRKSRPAHANLSAEEKAAMLERINQAFAQMVPHNAALGLQIVDFGPDFAVMRLPYQQKLVGNPDTGVLHGGAITALMDATSGAAVFMRQWSPVPIATLDLRIDYLRPATPNIDILARAECYRLTKSIAFTRAVAYHEADAEKLVASAAGAFMISTKGRSVMGSAKVTEG